VLAEDGNEAIGSMGDDTPMAVLSRKVRSPYDYLRQQFAQVTNPPIDPIREAIVMSLATCVGPERNLFEETADHAHQHRHRVADPVARCFPGADHAQRPGLPAAYPVSWPTTRRQVPLRERGGRGRARRGGCGARRQRR
jgi:hypothetical protein